MDQRNILGSILLILVIVAMSVGIILPWQWARTKKQTKIAEETFYPWLYVWSSTYWRGEIRLEHPDGIIITRSIDGSGYKYGDELYIPIGEVKHGTIITIHAETMSGMDETYSEWIRRLLLDQDPKYLCRTIDIYLLSGVSLTGWNCDDVLINESSITFYSEASVSLTYIYP